MSMLPPGARPDGQPPRPKRFPLPTWPKPRPSGVPSGAQPAPQHSLAALFAAGFGGALVAAVLLIGGYLLVVDRPPHPQPTPPVPVPVGPLRVILVSDPGANASKGQLEALDSTAVRGWLKAHCGKDSVGRDAWRSWPADMDVTNEPDDWRKAWATAKPLLGPLPQVVVFHGEKAKALPLPDSEKGLLDLLAKEGAN